MAEDDLQLRAGARRGSRRSSSQVRKKDTSLEKSLDLLEEGVRLANLCTELIDHADWRGAATAEPTPRTRRGRRGAAAASAEAAADGRRREARMPTRRGAAEDRAATSADPADEADARSATACRDVRDVLRGAD